MTRATLGGVYDKLKDVETEIQSLKNQKVDERIYEKDLELIETKLEDIRKDVRNINQYARWAILLVGGAIITALLNIVIQI